MKKIAKVFLISCICFSLAILMGTCSYIKRDSKRLEGNIGGSLFINNAKEVEDYSNLEEAIEKAERINILILGIEDVRTDTIILASLCPVAKKVNLINIPRDTYIHRKGYNGAAQRKVNSVYQDHGIEGVKKTISYILRDIPIHHHIILDYEGVENIVNGMGGIEVNVPFHMKYEDPTEEPPLVIDIKEGRQVLDGETALKFLRFRKGSNCGYVDGDLGRIKAQQDFIKSFIGKASNNILTVIKNGFTHVKTDIGFRDSIFYGKEMMGINEEDLIMERLPGRAEFKKVNKKLLSYYVYDKKASNNLIESIYNVKR